MHFITKALKISAAAILLFSFTDAEPTKVSLMNHRGESLPFEIKRQKLEWVNGKLNLSILSTDNRLLQLNHLESALVKDTVFKSSKVSMLLISGSRTYTQNNRILPVIEIESPGLKSGNPIRIKFSGKLFFKRLNCAIEADFSGTIPSQKKLTTN